MARAAARAADGCSRRASTAILPAVRSQCAPSLSVECSVRGRDERWALEPGGGSSSDEDSEDGNDLSDESLSDDE